MSKEHELRQQRDNLRAEFVQYLRSDVDHESGEARDVTEKFESSLKDLASQIAKARAESLEAEIRESVAENMEVRKSVAANSPVIHGSAQQSPMADFCAAIRNREARTLQLTLPSKGGYAAPADTVAAGILTKVEALNFMRTLGTVFPVPLGGTLGKVTLDTVESDASWGAEIGSVSADTSLALGKREIRPNSVRKLIKISRVALSQGILEQMIQERMSAVFARTEEKGYLTGTGAAGNPLGVFTASDDGITTARDVSTDNTTTAFTSDGLINAYYALRPAYRNRASWLFHTDAIKMMAKLTDGVGQPLWAEPLRAGDPPTFKGRPLYESEFSPNTFTSGQYVGILGDFSYYWIAQADSLSIESNPYLFQDNNIVGIYGDWYLDGAPVMSEAFSRVKLA